MHRRSQDQAEEEGPKQHGLGGQQKLEQGGQGEDRQAHTQHQSQQKAAINVGEGASQVAPAEQLEEGSVESR